MTKTLLASLFLSFSIQTLSAQEVVGRGVCKATYCTDYGCTPMFMNETADSCKKVAKKLAKENAAKQCKKLKKTLASENSFAFKSVNCKKVKGQVAPVVLADGVTSQESAVNKMLVCEAEFKSSCI